MKNKFVIFCINGRDFYRGRWYYDKKCEKCDREGISHDKIHNGRDFYGNINKFIKHLCSEMRAKWRASGGGEGMELIERRGVVPGN